MTALAGADRAAAPLIPRRALVAGAGVLALSVVSVGALRLAGWRPQRHDAAGIAERRLHFRDRADGGIDIVDAASGAALGAVHGEQGFLRGALRSLVRERRRRGGDASAPFTLIGRADGRLTLADATTGQRIDLESFGPTNAAVFARWLTPGEKP